MQSDVTDNAVQIYSDNIAMTRWLQEEIESLLYAPFADQNLPVIEAMFAKSGDPILTAALLFNADVAANSAVLFMWVIYYTISSGRSISTVSKPGASPVMRKTSCGIRLNAVLSAG